MSKRISYGLFVLTLLLAPACTPVWTGNTMQDDIETLKAQQKVMMESSQAERAELTEMIASARADVGELKAVLQEARELLQLNNANLGVEIQQTREEVERLRGKTEEIEFRFARMEQDLRLFKEDVDLRFAGGAHVVLPEKADELFEFASNKLEIQDYRIARRALEAFLARHGGHSKVDEATFMLGETYFYEKQWVGAIFEYQKILQNHARSSRSSLATYRIGEAFLGLGKCAEATVFFEAVLSEHPGSRSVRDARQQLEKIKAGQCG